MSVMASKRDYYELLEVSRTCSAEELRKAFRRLARQHHPDVNQGSAEAEETFKQLKEAYDVLSDPEKRSIYDQYGHEGLAAGGGMGGGDFGVDLFDIFFGGGRRETRRRDAPQRGSDLRYDLELTLEEAAAGIEKTINIDREQNCSVCTGTGAREGTTATVCSTCGGAGQVRRSQQTILGSFSTVTACPRCQGEGSIVSDPCPACRGRGRERVEVELKVNIPAGVDTGMALTVPGEGDRGRRGGRPGDLAVVMHVKAHDRFERRGRDLITEMPLSFPQAALGAKIPVATLTGETEIVVPAGTQYGHIFRVRGEGVPDVNGRGRGDMHVVAHIQVPEKLNDRQRTAIEELAASFGDADGSKTERHGLRGLLERAKEALDLD